METGVLFIVVERGELEDLRVLVEHGEDVHVRNHHGWSLLHRAAWSKGAKIARFLVKSGLDVHVVDKEGFTPLHSSAWSGNEKVSRFLIKSGADVHATTSGGSTPLQAAAKFGHKGVVSVLLHAGADRFRVDSGNMTPLSWAKHMSWRQVIDLLKSWPSVVTLRTLCIRKIQREQIHWKGLLPPILLEYPDELEEQKAFQKRGNEIINS